MKNEPSTRQTISTSAFLAFLMLVNYLSRWLLSKVCNNSFGRFTSSDPCDKTGLLNDFWRAPDHRKIFFSRVIPRRIVFIDSWRSPIQQIPKLTLLQSDLHYVWYLVVRNSTFCVYSSWMFNGREWKREKKLQQVEPEKRMLRMSLSKWKLPLCHVPAKNYFCGSQYYSLHWKWK